MGIRAHTRKRMVHEDREDEISVGLTAREVIFIL